MTEAKDTNHMGGRCGDCHFRWVVAYLPMPVDKFVTIARAARCPKCASAKVFVALSSE